MTGSPLRAGTPAPSAGDEGVGYGAVEGRESEKQMGAITRRRKGKVRPHIPGMRIFFFFLVLIRNRLVRKLFFFTCASIEKFNECVMVLVKKSFLRVLS